MNVSARWNRKLCVRHRNVELKDVKYPMRMGQPSGGMPGRREHSAILTYRQAAYLGATGLEKVMENATGIHIPHNTIHNVLKDEKMANIESKKSRKRKWVRSERTYSDSMWYILNPPPNKHNVGSQLCQNGDYTRMVSAVH